MDALLAAGIRLFQLRDKSGLQAASVDACVARIRAVGGLTIINDEIALADRADGIHLGQEDLALVDLPALRRRLGPRAIVGISCGAPAEAMAVDPALVDYLGVGPIFATGTKADAGAPIGVAGVRAVSGVTPLPVAAIGGIREGDMGAVRASGAVMAAVIGALAEAADPASAARRLVAAWG